MEPFLAAVASFETLPVPAGVLDLDGTILAVNAAGSRLLARPAAQLVGHKAWEFAPGAEHIWQDILASARAADYHGEIAIATPVGPRTIHYIVGLRQHEERTVALMMAVEVADASEGDRLRLVESLGLVAGGIAHDFNNQLVSVLGEASAAREDASVSPQVQQALERIEAAAQRMAITTRQLLAYAGRGRLVTTLLDPDDLVGLMQEQLQRSVRRDAELIVSVSRTHSAVEADPALLTEVVANLVINASESLPPTGGTVRVATSVQSREDGGTWWRLQVSDDGVGMDTRMVARIFDPFFTTKPERHGLGLSAVYGIVRRLGGEIAVDSKPSTGTTFHVRLPVVTGAKALPTTAPSVPPRRGTLTGVTILVADDETTVRSTMRRLLERRGASVIVASDGEEAAARLRERSYDLVVLDVMMPKLTGYQLLPIARETQPTAKVMLMSGYTDARGGNGQLEPDAFLEKPFTAKQIDDMISSLLA